MLKRLAALFRRYCDAHTRIEGRAAAIAGPEGRAAGRIDRIILDQDQLRLQGWAEAGTLWLCAEGPEGPLEARADIAPGGGAFDLALPRARASRAAAALRFAPGDHDQAAAPATQPLRLPDPRWHRLKLALRFTGQLIRLVPALAGWATSRDPRHRQSVKRGLGLDRLEHCGPLAAEIFGTAPPAPRADTPVTILLPVYNAHDLLLDCLDRVRRHTDLPWRMIAIEDASSDPRIRPALRAWAGDVNADASGGMPGSVQVIETARNLGFVGAVNAGLEAVLAGSDGAGEGGPVVLLNSDALVPPGWASRLIAPMRSDPGVASVTPMSNDAEIFSVPMICAATALQPGQAEAIDQAAQRLAPGVLEAQAPTGVGFCMAMSARFLAALPRFDPAFGRGYGEEVDWCQKARAMGGRHVGLAGLFVEHRGGASFGSEEKRAMVAANNRIVAQRYPAYDGEVQRFIRDDPLLSARIALGLVWAGSLEPDSGADRADPVPVYLAHSLGGGAEHWLQARIAARPGPSVVLRVGGVARWRIELHGGAGAGGMTAATTDDLELVLRLLEPLGARRIVYSCGVGDADPLGLPECLLRLRRAPQDRLEVLFHDYLPISPAYTLLDADGGFRGAVTPGRIAAPERRGTAANHHARGADGQEVTLARWQAAWGALLAEADEIRVFSKASHALVAASWPELAGAIDLAPHALLHDVPRIDPPRGAARPVVAVLGNIAPHKGAALLVRLARRLKPARGRKSGADTGGALPRLVLIGQIDPGYGLPRHVTVHGSYRVPELPALAARYGITHWLIPSVWPETFSFATHEALATGLPVLAFDIGAQGEAAAAAENGHVIAYDPGIALDALAGRVLEAVARSAPRPPPGREAMQPA